MDKLYGHARRPVDFPINHLNSFLLEPGKILPSLLVTQAHLNSKRGKHLAKLVQFVDFHPLVPIRVVGHDPVGEKEIRLKQKNCWLFFLE